MTDPQVAEIVGKGARGAAFYRGSIVRLDVCCNDHRDGSFDARACAIQLPDQLAELEADDMRGPVFREYVDTIQISRRRFPCGRSKEWYGNWCWNAYWLDVADAVELVAYVHTGRAFQLTCGEERLFNRWRRPEPFTDGDKDMLARLWCKAMLDSRP